MCLSGIVNILTPEGKSFGTGFFVSPKGYILTCKHVLTLSGYQRIGELIFFKYADDSAHYQAEWVESGKEADLAILYTSITPPNYIPMCSQNSTGVTAECYGFPNSSQIRMKDSVLVEQFFDYDNRIQLGKANTVTRGFSGGPVLYNGTAIGVIGDIAPTDSYGRMNGVAVALSAQLALKLFPKYISKKELCIGYGEREKKCVNYVSVKDASAKALGLCEECYTQKFTDDIKALYKAQNYRIHEADGFFVTELKYGASTYFDAVFTFVKFSDTVKLDELYCLPYMVGSSGYAITQTIIITNVELDKDCDAFIKSNQLTVTTKEDLLRSLFDFDSYREDLLSHVHSDQLSTHYIEVYGTVKFPEENKKRREYGKKEYLYKASEEDYLQRYCGPVNSKLLLKEYVTAFLKSKHQALLILGDYGSGKTSFCYTYTLELLDQFIQNRSTYFPLLVKLRGYNKAIGLGQVLTDYFVNDLGVSNFNIRAFKLLLKNINAILIFDGYDEVAKKVDFDIKYEVLREVCNLAEARTKVIITCRPNYFQNASEFQKIFQNSHLPYEPGDKPMLEFMENSIADLNESQIDGYIDSYQSELAESNISKEELIHTIANTHDLSDLVKRPFLLYMIMSTLPKILRETKGKKDAKINASKLYQVYTDNWLRREDQKNKTLIKRADKELFCKELALELYTSNAESLSYRDLPASIKRNFRYIDQEEDIDYFSHDIQSCSFLTSDRSGEFKFIHKSFMEYFVADQVVRKLDGCFSKAGKPERVGKRVNDILGRIPLSMEICMFISDILPSVKRELVWEVTDIFGYLNDIAVANMLSIVSKTNFNMSEYLQQYLFSYTFPGHVDFGGAKFTGGVIERLSFQDAQFYSSALNGTTFVECDFQGAVFEKATLNNVKFYGCQFISSNWRESKLVNCVFGPVSSKEEPSDSYDKIQKDYWGEAGIPCDLENSVWRSSTLKSCFFQDCSLVDNDMKSINILDSTFEDVDFSGTHTSGYGECRNNKMYGVLGAPYEF